MMNVGTSSLSHSMMAGTSLDDILEQSSSLVDSALNQDRLYPDLTEQLQIIKHNQPSVSGLHDFDYPSLSDQSIGLASLTELGSIKKVPLPAELLEQFGHMQCNCLMGLFPEIHRAWLSIDSDIFVWNYEDGSDLAYFDGLGETILSAGLVRPKPGIFQPHIVYLLCLTTPVDIVLLGVSFTKPGENLMSDPGTGEMHLLPEPLFSIPTDSSHILNVAGSHNGRIFMAGKDGCLYELHYQAEDGWFSRKCRKINHSTSKISYIVPSFLNFSFAEDDALVQITIDDSRNILYTRSEKGTIQVYDLGEDGHSTGRVAAISQHTTMQYASHTARTIDKSNFQQVVHISAIPKSESVNIHLVAVTHTGVRLYFAINPFGNNRARPSMLTMVHVRLPPGFSATASTQRPNNVHMAHYKNGTMLLASSQSEDSDILWTVGPDSFPFQKNLMETMQLSRLDGRVWALAEVPITLPEFQDDQSQQSGPLQRADPPLVVTQHMLPARRFVLLNAQGSYLVNKLSPVDQLKQLLLNNSGPDAMEVEAFFKLHKVEQACATCLILACSSLHQAEQQVCDWATRAYFKYGGEPEYNFGGSARGQPYGAMPASPQMPGYNVFSTPGPGFHPSQVSTPYPASSQHTSQLNISGIPNTSFTMQQEVIFSGKHNGLCLYLGRLLRPIWEYRMVSDIPGKTEQGSVMFLASRLRGDELSWFAEQLKALRIFLERNSKFASPLLAENFAAAHSGVGHRSLGPSRDGQMDEQTRRKFQSEAAAQESQSLQNIQQLVNHICECLGLWQTLSDHQFHVVAACLNKDQQNTLRMMNFRSFVSTGREISSALIQCLINRYLNDNAATDSISSHLREVCPSLYSFEDALCSKANEKLQGARGTQSRMEKNRQLHEALEHYKKITAQLELPTVRHQFAAVHFYPGIVDLSLTAASKRDPQGLALHFYRNGEPVDDIQGQQAYIARMECYHCITDSLWELLSTSMSHPQAPSVPKTPGPPPPQDPNLLTNQEAEQYAEQMLELSLKSDDEMFHVALYDWLVEKNLTEKLLEIQSPYLEPYLKRAAALQPDHLAMLDLLWKYYEKSRNYSAAARILAKLADRHSTAVSLQQRLEYLSRATINAKSSSQRTSSATEGEFLHELEEKMEVARLQQQVYDALIQQRGRHPQLEDALSRLNSELLDISLLFSEFADVYDLSECKLAIIHSAAHYDPTLVESLWQDIVDKELRGVVRAQAAQQMNTLSNKLVALGRMYGGTERYFPLPFLVKYLERRSCELNFNPTFVFSTVQEIGVTLSKLQEIYDRLFKSKDPCWQALRKPFHLLNVICHLLNTYADNPTMVPAYERRQFTTVCLDSVASYLVELQATSSTDPTVIHLLTDFKAVQAKLERL